MKGGLLRPYFLAGVFFLNGCVLPPTKPREGLPVHQHVGREVKGGAQKWNPVWWLGNADTTEPPDDYRPGQKNRRTLWYWRNPLHNFTFYVIGVADRDFARYGKEPDGVFAREGGWNWAVIRLGWIRLPFVSYKGKHVRFYMLWRESGNFGLKLNMNLKGWDPDPPRTPKGKKKKAVVAPSA
jgi:hypothetical protein